MKKGIISNIQKYSTEDGPGIRTTVFMKGCPLRCLWCQNPENINFHPEVVWYDTKCTRCGRCIEVCPEGATSLTKDEKIVIDRKLCKACGNCVEACPNKAREIMGKLMTTDEVLADVEKDRVFYDVSGGGVTASGGEPIAQPEFLLEFFKKCKDAKIHTALDTCGYVKWKILERILPYVDLMLYDLKEMDPEKHASTTGVLPYLIWENLKKIDNNYEILIWIRTPIVPGYTDDEENIRKIAKFVTELKHVERWELLPYNPLAESKYEHLGRQYPLIGVQPPPQECMKRLEEIGNAYGVNKVIAK